MKGQWSEGANKSMRIKALLKYRAHIHTQTHSHTHTPGAHTCKTIKCAYKIFNASKNAGKCQKMPEKSKAIPSRFPFENVLCRFSITLNAPDHLPQRDFYCSCCFNIFICLLLLLFFVFFWFVFCFSLSQSHWRSTIAACSPTDWVNK